MTTKQELLTRFSELQPGSKPPENINCVDCNHCADCKDCVSCTACTHCFNCYHCEGCDYVTNAALCVSMEHTNPNNFYLLNEEVTREEFDAAVAALSAGEEIAAQD